MLTARAHVPEASRYSASGRRLPAGSQRGMVLVMAIIVLVALTLASLALTRSVYTSNVIAGNLAFQRAATNSAEAGVDEAVKWLEDNNALVATAACANGRSATRKLDCDDAGSGYLAATKNEPAADQGWNEHWKQQLAASSKSQGKDQADNDVSFVIERMCKQQGDAQAVENGCTVSPAPGQGTCNNGSSCAVSNGNVAPAPPVYYRITVFVEGPRNTRSMVQAMVAL